jgi:hypothetical protein
MSYNCFLPAIESNKRRGWGNRRTVITFDEAEAQAAQAKARRGRTASSIYAPSAKHSDQAGKSTTYASLPSGLTVPRYSVPQSYLKRDSLSLPSAKGKNTLKPVTTIDDTSAEQQDSRKKSKGKEADKKGDGKETNKKKDGKQAAKDDDGKATIKKDKAKGENKKDSGKKDKKGDSKNAASTPDSHPASDPKARLEWSF